MYLETIFVLQKDHGHAHVADIAEQLGVTMPSVSKAMQRLKTQGLVHQASYGSVTLTTEGEAIAQAVYYKHQTITSFLQQALALSPEEATKNACRMEHIITDAMLQAIEHYLTGDEQ